jgi:hypothetical protein
VANNRLLQADGTYASSTTQHLTPGLSTWRGATQARRRRTRTHSTVFFAAFLARALGAVAAYS